MTVSDTRLEPRVLRGRLWTLARLVALLFALFGASGTAEADGVSPDAALRAELRALMAEAGLGEQVALSVRDVNQPQALFTYRAQKPLNPASNMKLVTAAAALAELGADFQIDTALYGRVQDGTVDVLTLTGFGDPTLSYQDLLDMCLALRDRGVRRVDRIQVDGSYFDPQVLPPGFDQQPNEAAPFRAAVAAVSVDRSTYALRVVPGPGPESKARVRLRAPGYFEVDNQMHTTAGGGANVIAVQRPNGERLSLKLRGSVPANILGVTYRRRVAQPLLYAGHALSSALQRVGIRARDPMLVSRGRARPGDGRLAHHRSAPLGEILRDVGKWSDNFVAEMVLKLIAAKRRRPAAFAHGTEALQAMLHKAGVQPGTTTIVNGSGLFTGNFLTAESLTKLLTHVYRQPGLRPEYLAQLSVGGVDGTLRGRLKDLPAERIVRAKTGTLNDVISLSGYVVGPRRVMAFSFLANGVRFKHATARQLADRCVAAIARALYPSAS